MAGGAAISGRRRPSDRAFKRWTHSNIDFMVDSHAIMPSADLLVLGQWQTVMIHELGREQRQPILHLRTLSTNEPHPLAAVSELRWSYDIKPLLDIRVVVEGEYILNSVKLQEGNDVRIWHWPSGALVFVSGFDIDHSRASDLYMFNLTGELFGRQIPAPAIPTARRRATPDADKERSRFRTAGVSAWSAHPTETRPLLDSIVHRDPSGLSSRTIIATLARGEHGWCPLSLFDRRHDSI